MKKNQEKKEIWHRRVKIVSLEQKREKERNDSKINYDNRKKSTEEKSITTAVDFEKLRFFFLIHEEN